MTHMNQDDQSITYRIVGRPDIDLSKYVVNINGRGIIDYEKMKNDDPALYNQILADENEQNHKDDIELGKLTSSLSS